MADGITSDIAASRLQLYLNAEAAVLDGQEYRFADGRQLTRADLGEIRAGVTYWSALVDRLLPVQRILPTPRAVGRVRGGVYRMR